MFVRFCGAELLICFKRMAHSCERAARQARGECVQTQQLLQDSPALAPPALWCAWGECSSESQTPLQAKRVQQ